MEQIGVFHLLFLAATVTLVSGQNYKLVQCEGNRSAIVHLFEWRWGDIAYECENFLGPMGFCGVQTSPVSENRIVTDPNRPWWERYQPISYKIETRSGNEQEFKDMVETCNKNGVRIYVDAVINHMAGAGHVGKGTGGSDYNSNDLWFPGVPFDHNDFNSDNCPTGDKKIHGYDNAVEIRNCRLEGLLDLKMGEDRVRDKVAGFLNHLLDLGVTGFRIDAAKHMWPGDIQALLQKVKKNKWGSAPFIVQEVIEEENQPIRAFEYFPTGRVTNFKYGKELAAVFRKQNPLKFLKNWGPSWGMYQGNEALNFIDNHDNQRGHGGGGEVLTNWESRAYKLANAFMLSHPYGVSRLMSSYEYNRDNNFEGPPHYDDMATQLVEHDGDLCKNGWICEHRWRQIANMVGFRNVAKYYITSGWIEDGDWRIAYSRGDKAFIAFNLDDSNWKTTLKTGLSEGEYCDIISGNLEDDKCTGIKVKVDAGGNVDVDICSSCDDPMLAIHVGAKIGSPPRRI